MSTKIYNGARLREGVDVFDFCAKLRELFLPIYEETVETWTILYATREVLRARDSGEPVRRPLARGYSIFEEAERERQWRLTEMVVAFAKDPVSGRILVRPYIDNNDYLRVWDSLDEVERWGYWNSADQPEDVSDEEWEERRETWDRVFGDDPVSERSLCFTLVELMKGLGPGHLRTPLRLVYGEPEEQEEIIRRRFPDWSESVPAADLLG